jgi:DNA-binding MarR family transcriptional regulator
LGQAGNRLVAGGKLPNSCIQVLSVLHGFDSGCSQKTLVEQTGLSVRSVKGALKELVASRMVVDIFLFDDLRRKIYTIGGGDNGNK